MARPESDRCQYLASGAEVDGDHEDVGAPTAAVTVRLAEPNRLPSSSERDAVTFGRQVRKLREDRRWSQYELESMTHQ